MNYTEVKKKLKKEFENILKPLGYKPKSDAQGCEFGLIKDNYQYIISYGVANYIDEFKTSCVIFISNKIIDKIVKLSLNDDITYTLLACRYADYLGVVNYYYDIIEIEDINNWIPKVKDFLFGFAFDFFEKYNSINELDIFFNTTPAEKTIYSYDLSTKIINSLIVAKLNNNPKYNELMNYYKSEIENKFQGYFMYEKCMKVINFLEKYTSEELNKLANEI